VAAVRPAGAAGRVKWRAELVYYQPAAGLAAALGAAYDAEPDGLGCFLDPMPCAQILDAVRERAWVHALEAVDVAAAAGQFRQAVKAREIEAAEHPALEQAITYAVRRPLAAAFGFERRRVPVDMSPLNASAFALFGLRQHEASAEPGVWVI
jgi:hypothetical protein